MAKPGAIPPGRGDEYKEVTAELGTPSDNREITKYANRLPDSRKVAVLKSWAAGMTFAELAVKFEFASAGIARLVVERALADSDISVDRAAERARFTVSLLTHHQKAAMKAEDDEDPNQMAWMRMDLLVIDRLAKLLGLDAPTQVVITPGADEFEKLTAAVAIANGAKTVIEADPMAEDDEDEEGAA